MKRTIAIIVTLMASLGPLSFQSTASKAQSVSEERKLPLPVIKETLSISYQSVQVLGSKVTYLEQGQSRPYLTPRLASFWVRT